MITYEDYMMGRDKGDEAPSEALKANANKLLNAVNALLRDIFEDNKELRYMGISSGYRPPSVNKNVKGAASKSAHLTCEAVDLRDGPDQKLGRFLTANPEYLIKHALYMESITVTKGWVHLQTRPTKSGNRIFYP